MSPTGNIDVAAKAMIEEIIRVCAARLGADATSAPADVPAASGWTLTVPVTGAAEGRLVIWFDRASAAAYVRTVAGTPEGEAAPADEAIADRLVELVQEAAAD